MNTPHVLPFAGVGGAHPSVRRRRVDRGLRIALAGLLAFLIALAATVATPNPNIVLEVGLVVGALGVVALATISRLEVTVTIVALYLGMIDGPLKLMVANQAASSIRDVVIAAVAIGAITRLLMKPERVNLPPLSGWVAMFVGLVLIEAINPHTTGLTKVIGGFRQNLEWVPFFFFGYALIRTKARFQKLFIILGVMALANGLVSAYQTRLTPPQLASWGPGYAERVNGNVTGEPGTGGVTGRKYVSEGVERVRPLGLGSDSGFGGGVGLIALPGTLALLATKRRRRWVATLLCLGALLAVATCLGRLQVVGSVIAMFTFVLLSLSAGRRVTRPLGALLAVAALALPLGALFVSSEGAGVFSRYESIQPNSVVETSTTYKEQALTMIPHYISKDPFGFGLATAGPAAAFGGSSSGVLEGHGITAETQYNYVVDELGAPGLLLWLALTIQIIVLVIRRLPRIANVDIRIDLAAVFAVFIAYGAMGLRGAFSDTASGGPFFWFAIGIAAYWLAGPGRRADARGQVPAT
jgi:hypothetical protein